MTEPAVNEPHLCPTCRTQIPPDSPGGACPRCLMALAFATDAGAPPPDVPVEDVQRRFPAYDILGTLGRGGMGVVFRARQKALDREVALKVLPVYGDGSGARSAGGPSRPAGFTERFEREARALARVQHPGIVQVFDFGTSPDGWCFLAMELVDGANLRHVLADRRLAPKEALAIVPQICDALQYAHDHGVVHRDVKPENVLLTKDGRVKIADFGLAKLVEDARGGPARPDLTHTGHSMGTPVYMAPEQIESPGDVDHRADIYSLGVVFYEMLTGELPIGRFAPPSRKSDVDARIDAIVLRTLEKERAARFQRVDEVTTRITEASGPMPPAVVAAPKVAMSAASAADTVAMAPRVSKLAVMCAFAPLAAGLVVGLAWAAYRTLGHEVAAGAAAIWAAAFSFVAVVASLVAWGRIRHSDGAKFGRLFAGLGLLAPVAAAATFASFVKFEDEIGRGFRGYAFESGSPDAESLANVAARDPDVDMVRALLDRYVSSDRGNFDAARALYAPDERQRLDALPAATRAARADAGLLGLPLATDAFLGARSDVFVFSSVMFTGTEGKVRLRSGAVTVTAPIVRVTDPTTGVIQWYFRALPIERTTSRTMKPKPTVGTLDAEILAAKATLDRLTIDQARADDDPDVLNARRNLAQLEASRSMIGPARLVPSDPSTPMDHRGEQPPK